MVRASTVPDNEIDTTPPGRQPFDATSIVLARFGEGLLTAK
jgi:hypothetical protein